MRIAIAYLKSFLTRVGNRFRRASGTNILVFINALAFLALLAFALRVNGPDIPPSPIVTPDQLRQVGANYGPLTIGRQYWRLVTSLFLHVGLWHLLVNMLCLWLVGRQLERQIGRATIFVTYIVSGVAGCVLSIYLHPTLITCGSSGSVMGLAGVLLALLGFAKLDLPRRTTAIIGLWTILLVQLTFISGFRATGIDSASHIGGLGLGLVFGSLLSQAFRRNDDETRARQRNKIACYMAIIMLVIVGGLIKARPDIIELYQGELALEHKQSSAIFHIQKYVAKNPNDSIGHGDLAYAYEDAGRCDTAAAEYSIVLQLAPVDHAAQYNLARIYTYCMNRASEAVPLFRESLPHLVPTADKYFFFGAALHRIGNLTDARKAALQGISLDPKFPRNHMLLGNILDEMGMHDQAAQEHELAEHLFAPK